MIFTNWPEAVNTNFFSMNSKPVANTELTSYISGRVVAWQRNSKNNFVYNCKLLLDVEKEVPLFWNWFNNTLGQTAGAFACAALGDKVYRFNSIPEADDTDNAKRIFNLEIVEV